jgi:hypothetical protein
MSAAIIIYYAISPLQRRLLFAGDFADAAFSFAAAFSLRLAATPLSLFISLASAFITSLIEHFSPFS